MGWPILRDAVPAGATSAPPLNAKPIRSLMHPSYHTAQSRAHHAVSALVTVAALAVAACTDPVTPSAPRPPAAPSLAKGGGGGASQGPGRIYFSAGKHDPQYADVYVIEVGTDSATRLTDAPGHDSAPSASRDGKALVFSSNRDGNYELYTMKPDGSGQTRVTNTPAHESHPEFSPDGRRIAFLRYDPQTATSDLFIMRTNGTGLVQVTSDGMPKEGPTWSPDGTQIAYAVHLGDNWEVVRVNVDGTGLVNLSNDPVGNDINPAWAPDGSLVAFASDREFLDTGTREIYTVTPDGANLTRRTFLEPVGAQYPVWSPNSQKLAFWVSDDPMAVLTMNLDGTNLEKVYIGLAAYPSWGK